MVPGLALEACTRSILRRPLKGYEGKDGALWEHNLRTAITARELAKFTREKISMDIAFSGGNPSWHRKGDLVGISEWFGRRNDLEN